MLRQVEHHLLAIQRGLAIDGSWVEVANFIPPEPLRLLVEAKHGGFDRIDAQAAVKSIRGDSYSVALPWSYDSLRAASYRLVHRFMAEVGR